MGGDGHLGTLGARALTDELGDSRRERLGLEVVSPTRPR